MNVNIQVSRRGFLKAASTGVAGTALGPLGFSAVEAAEAAHVRAYKLATTTETRNTCPYCSVACGVILYSKGDVRKGQKAEITHVEGDADHPTNRGTLCPKGSSLQQEIMNDRRLLKPQVRRPGATDWQDISWDDAINEIAARIKKTRDENFVEKDAAGHTVNRLESLAFIGGCTDTNEFNYLAVKAMRALGVVHLENQARV